MANKELKPNFPYGLSSQGQNIFENGYMNDGLVEHGANAMMTVPTDAKDDFVVSAVRYNATKEEFEGAYKDGWRSLGGGGVIWVTAEAGLEVKDLVKGYGYLVDTRSTQTKFILPKTPAVGTSISVCDLFGSFSTAPLTVSPNGNMLYGKEDDMVVSTDHVAITFTYSGETQGWVVTAGVGLGQGRVYNRTVKHTVLSKQTTNVLLDINPAMVDIYVNGSRLADKYYTLEGYNVSFNPALPSGVELQVIEFTPVQLTYSSYDKEMQLLAEKVNSLTEKTNNQISGFTFKTGALLKSQNDFIYDETTQQFYYWGGEFPKLVPAGSNWENGVGWVSGDSILRKELTDENGVLKVANGVVYTSSLSNMIAIPDNKLKDGLQIITKEYKLFSGIGGGRYFYSENTEKRYHDGGTIISPTVPLTEDQMNYLKGIGETDIYGKGCFVRYVDDFVNPEWFGARPLEDVTEILTHVISKAKRVEVTNNYLIDVEKSVSLVTNTVLRLGDSVLTAKPTSKARHDLLRIVDADNVKIIGGFLVGEREGHQGTTGEHGYGIFVSGKSRNILIQNTHASNFWGDGFYIGASNHKNLKNITMVNCTSDNNRRQGLSITSGEYIYIQKCEFSNTNGTTPQDGICIEPNIQQDPTQKVRYVIVDGCYSHGNAGDGFAAIGRTLDRNIPENSGMLNCSIINCVSRGNLGDGIKANESFNLIITGNHVTESSKNGIHLMVACDSSTISNNRVISCGLDGILMNNGCWDNTISSNYISKSRIAVNLYNSRGNNISGNNIKECDKGVLMTQSLRNSVTSNIFSEIKYQGVVNSNPTTKNNKITDNIFHNVAFSDINESEGVYGAIIDFVGGASYNLVNNNLFTHDTDKAPKRSYCYVRNSTTIQNKIVYNNFQDTSVPKLYTESGPSIPSNEVVEISTLYKHPW